MYLKFAEDVDILVQIVNANVENGGAIGILGAKQGIFYSENYFSSLYFIVATSKLQPSVVMDTVARATGNKDLV